MKRIFHPVMLVLLTLSMLAAPVLVGCSSDSQEKNEIKIGWLWDLTGRSASAVIETYDGLRDYVKMSLADDPIPDVNVKFIHFDTRSDPARVAPGYVWMKSQGVHIVSAAPQDCEILRSSFEQDRIPFYGVSNVIPTLDSEWLFSNYGPVEWQVEVLMQYILETWTEDAKPKVAFVGFAGVPFFDGQKEMAVSLATSHADDIDWLGAHTFPASTMNFVSEIDKTKSADFIVVGMTGSPLAAFAKEARSRGYQNKFLSPLEGFWAFWGLVKEAVPVESRGTILTASYMPWWDEDVSFINEIKEYMEANLSESQRQKIYNGTGRINGWAAGTILMDAIRRAVEDVGPDNITPEALRTALAETDLDFTEAGYGNRWKLSEGVNCFAQAIKLLEYDPDVDKWLPATGFSDWRLPSALGG